MSEAPSYPHDEEDLASLTAAVEAARRSLAAGKSVPWEEARKWLLSWGTENELPPPRCE